MISFNDMLSASQICRLVILCIFASALAGCGNKVANQKVDAPAFESDVKIFGLLEKVGGEYRFTRFRTNAPAYGSWVDLQTGAPTWNISKQRCGRGIVKDRVKKNVPDCDDLVSEALFLEANLDGGDAAIRLLAAPLTMGLTLTGTSYEVEFNVEKFGSAYQAAAATIDWKVLKSVGGSLARLNSDWRDVRSAYQLALRNRAISIEVIDKSGFNPSNVNARSMVRPEGGEISAPSMLFEGTSPDSLLSQVEEAGATVRRLWENERTTARANCGPADGDFVFAVSCPPYFEIVDGTVKGSATVTVLYRRSATLKPPQFVAEDRVISLIFDGDRLRFSNNTDQFATVDSVSVYYDSAVHTLPVKLSLPPKSVQLRENELRLSAFNLTKKTIERFTKSEVQSQSLRFGFAVKYRVANISKERTIFTTREFSYQDLI